MRLYPMFWYARERHGKRILSVVTCAIALAAVVAPASAQGLPAATVRPNGSVEAQSDRQAARERCKADPQQCRAEMKARREARCSANPQRCEEMKARMKQRQAQCKADPEKCRAEMKARREERCKANPQRCEEMKARFEERRAECQADPAKCRAGKGGSPDGR